ncbi:MAG: family 78 glycoside hydrolase catalytic domain [Anaerolineae bacterium]|nr:family 78 glycoside hydrolase catalytic domain [Anaerolineae bacterium]
MKIVKLKTNHIENPLGFTLGRPRVSWAVEETKAIRQVAAQVRVAADDAFQTILFDSGKDANANSLAFELPLELEACTRYYWQVTVWGDNGETATSEIAWFETAKMDQPWQAQWISPDWEDQTRHPLLRKEFSAAAPVVSARIYAVGLGLYKLEMNGKPVGDEVLTPGYHAYNRWIQYQTYDVTGLVQAGDNVLGAMLGNGWYKGRFGFTGNAGGEYGDTFGFLCELHLTDANGNTTVIGSDLSWKATVGPVLDSSIYDGETYDANQKVCGWSKPGLDTADWKGVKPFEIDFNLVEARRNLPIKIMETLPVAEVIHTPAGETVLDMGQNMVGWLRFKVNAPKGTEIMLQWGEVLQGGNFFRDNLRSARAEYHYISDGKEAIAEPNFTFYGGRYIKVSGWEGELNPDDFTGCVVYSDMEQTGQVETAHPLVNRLFLNALWGQKGNFVDVPTDCPQRDERMGWTGDAQVFSGTACMNMDVAAFFSKYLHDMWMEQIPRGGNVPFVVPSARATEGGAGSSAWGDAATVIPWNVYLHYGDKAILEQQFESMKGWVDYIKGVDDSSGGRRLWTVGFSFGDWLALDGEDPLSPMGGTPTDFISSAYYCYSAGLTAKAAKALGKTKEAQEYQQLADEVRDAIRAEYFTPTGRLAINTQTAHVVSLFMDLAPEKFVGRIEDDLRARLLKDKEHLKTGFVGTPYLCRTLSMHNANDLAYTLLLHEDFPSWLYAVKLGATTIWERWNSLLPDGTISDLTMNSFNHYSYGSIVEWMYQHMLGLRPVEDQPGYRRAILAPQPEPRMKWAKGSLDSAAGLYQSEWKIGQDGDLTFHFRVPFNATAALTLPDADLASVTVNGKALAESGLKAEACGSSICVELTAGEWNFHYMPTKSYIRFYSSYTPIVDLMANEEVMAKVLPLLPEQMRRSDPQMMNRIGRSSLRDLGRHPMMRFDPSILDQVDEALKGMRMD